jgi:micrococcal nuclease
MSKRPKIGNRWLNRRTAQTVMLILFAGGALFRLLKPLWQVPPTPPRIEDTRSEPDTDSRVPVIRVIDGDTIKVRFRGKVESVRLLRINTPEKGQPGFAEATRALQALLGNKVRLSFETPGRPTRDTYGRLLAYIFTDETNANVEIVRSGWSRFWTKYGAGRLAPAFRAAELEARKKRLGLWAD